MSTRAVSEDIEMLDAAREVQPLPPDYWLHFRDMDFPALYALTDSNVREGMTTAEVRRLVDTHKTDLVSFPFSFSLSGGGWYFSCPEPYPRGPTLDSCCTPSTVGFPSWRASLFGPPLAVPGGPRSYAATREPFSFSTCVFFSECVTF